ncbi:MAG: transporter related [Deltaproteobacteria bacterium]|nr:transporter related [Deltaproteobacteria bacterium]
MLLRVENLTLYYDTAQVLDRLSFDVGEGEMVSLVGPNGAGKTTALRAVAGLINWEKEITRGTRLAKITYEGSITFNGESIEHLEAAEIAKRGLSLCPERGRPFREMTVMDNLRVGAYLCKDKAEIEKNLEGVFELFPLLKRRMTQTSGTLSGGEQTMLAVGRALMYRPRLLCIDEPSTGLAPLVKEELFQKIKDIFAGGMTMLLVEQDVGFAFALAGRNYVLSRGRIVALGKAEELLSDETVKKIYLGL